MKKMREVEPKENEKYREAFNTVVNAAEEIAPILRTAAVKLFPNPKHPGTGLIAANFGIPGRAERFSLIIGAIDTEGNPYSGFNRLAVTERSSIAGIQSEPEKRKPFTGYLRFSEKAEQIVHKMPGRINYLKSPFKDDNRTIYRITRGQFGLIEHLLKGEGIDYEIVEWPEDVEKPFVMPPGFY